MNRHDASAARAALLSLSILFPASPPLLADELYALVESSAVELFPGLSGPFPQSVTIEQCIAVDVGGISTRDDVVVYDGARLHALDLEDLTQGWVELGPAPPVPLDTLTAVNIVGNSRDDLVGAAGADLWILDLHQTPQEWTGPLPQPFEPRLLAALDLGGVGARRELVAYDGTRILYRDLEQGSGAWKRLGVAPAALEAMGGVDVVALDRLSVATKLAVVGGRSAWTWEGGAWSPPTHQRFELRCLASIHFHEATSPGSVDAREVLVTLARPEPALIRFSDRAAAAGLVNFTDPGGDMHGPGGIFADIDGDALADLYLVRGDVDGIGQPNQLLLNDGAGGFELQPGALGANDTRNGSGALLADYDNDGDRDIYVINYDARNTLYRNDYGTFVDVTALTDPTPTDPLRDLQEGVGIGLLPRGCGPASLSPCALNDTLTAAWGDVDRDGDLDLYVGNGRCCFSDEGERDVLYINNGDGTFFDATVRSGIATNFPADGARSSMSAMFSDLNGDLWPDLYVTHKMNGPDVDELFVNRGDDDADGVWDGFYEYFATLPASSTVGAESPSAMGIDTGDFDNDGDLDIYITDKHDCDLYRNLLADTGEFGLRYEPDMADPFPGQAWAWGTTWLDADNDGDLDLHVSTHRDIGDYLWRNDGTGAFTDVALAAGVGQARDTRASLAADYDRDGWVDYFTSNRGASAPTLYRNGTGAVSGNHWIQIELQGDPTLEGPFRSTRDAIGALVRVEADLNDDGLLKAEERQMREVASGTNTCASTASLVLELGLGLAPSVARIRVSWPSGRESELRDVEVDQHIVIREE